MLRYYGLDTIKLLSFQLIPNLKNDTIFKY